MSCLRIILLILLYLTLTASGSQQEIEDILRSALLQRYGVDDARIEDLKFSGSLDGSLIKGVDVIEEPSGLISFKIALTDGRIIHAKGRVTLLTRAVFTVRPLRRGAVISEDDVVLRLVEPRRVPPGAFKEKRQVVGRFVNRNLSWNMILTENMVDERAFVPKGKKVLIVVESQGFRISLPGELKEKARIGEPAKAVTLQTKRPISGLLIDENTLKVEF